LFVVFFLERKKGASRTGGRTARALLLGERAGVVTAGTRRGLHVIHIFEILFFSSLSFQFLFFFGKTNFEIGFHVVMFCYTTSAVLFNERTMFSSHNILT
jgi:hypothetical protein